MFMASNNFKKRVIGFCLVLLIFPLVVSILQITLWIRLVVWITYFLLLIYSGLMLWLYQKIQKQDRKYIQAKGEDILIIAPHQDDCVAIAGGYAVQTVEKGGHVYILYITDGYKEDRVTRRQEAVKAWSTFSRASVTLDFLPYINNKSFLSREEINKGIDEISAYIKKVKPETIFIPLYEGGHYQHDVSNFMVSMAVKKLAIDCTVYESPIYNFFMSFTTTPEKILSGLARFIPLITYDYSPEPVRNDQVYFLEMTDSQLQKKKNIIAEFKTQNPQKLMERWGFGDRYQKLHAYDYSQPPFNYDKSIAKWIHNLKTLPLIGKIMRKVMIWTTTIHPDPHYTMTNIPISSGEI
jgi:LmbE family N-acetylglucosaminyl deacetylase